MRLGVGAAAVVTLLASLAACGDDGKPDRTVAFVRTTGVAQESQDAFLEQLAEAGWEVGDNLTLLNPDPSSGFEDEGEIADAVEEFVADGADLVVALSTTGAMGAMQGTTEVPILLLANDPVASGIIANPREPESNVTGVSFRVPADRTIDLARQLVGEDADVGLLYPGDDAGAEPIVTAMESAAKGLDITLAAEAFVGDAEVQGAVDRLVQADVDVVIVANAPNAVRSFAAIEAATMAAGLPVIANTNVNEFAVVVLAPDNLSAYRQLGQQAARLLDETDVADVPLEDPGDFNVIVRASVARELGIDVPDDLLEAADEVID